MLQDDEKRWQNRALCKGLTRLFYDDVYGPDEGNGPADPAGLSAARAVCAACPVRGECFAQVMEDEAGMAAEKRYGIAAGMTPEQRWSAEKRNSVRDAKGRILDPLKVIDGRLPDRKVTPIPDEGDQWTRRHTTLARKFVAWLAAETKNGTEIPGPHKMSQMLDKARPGDMQRVYDALVNDGTLRQKGNGATRTYVRRRNPGVNWTPDFVEDEDGHGDTVPDR